MFSWSAAGLSLYTRSPFGQFWVEALGGSFLFPRWRIYAGNDQMYSASSRFINPKSGSQFHGKIILEKVRYWCTQQEKHGHEGGILSCGLANKELTGFGRLYVLKPKKRLFLQHALVLVHCSLYIFKGFFRVSPFSIAIVRKHALLHRTVRTILGC